MRLSYKLELLGTFNNHFYEYPIFINSNYFFGFGFLLGLCLLIQIFTGIFLSMHYVSNIELAFNSIEHIMRDVSYGWLIRYIHSNTASAFFICIYIHIGRGIFYKSFNNSLVWITGVIIFLLLMLTSFLGYILPWGQMSYWGAVVITNLVSAIPFCGDFIVTWLWGGFSVSNPTLNRFFILHYLFPFLLIGISCLHILCLHTGESKNVINIESWNCNINFTPYFLTKDILSLFLFIFLFIILIFFYPNFLGHSDNYIKANVLLTPLHIVPEWYFLPYYAILRAIPLKGLGVLLLLGSILILFLLAIIPCSVIPSKYDIIYNHFFFFVVAIFFKLMWLGGKPVIGPYITISRLSSFLYFSCFIVLPLLCISNFVFST